MDALRVFEARQLSSERVSSQRRSTTLEHLSSLNPAQVLKSGAKPYLPSFQKAFEHLCLHTGGRGVVDEIEKQLRLTPEFMQPSRLTLHRFGNVSSSSIWCANRVQVHPLNPNHCMLCEIAAIASAEESHARQPSSW